VTTFYVWGGSLRGVEVEASDARGAFIQAVVDQAFCLVHGTVRVSMFQGTPDPSDTFYTFVDEADFARQFPELANHPDLDLVAERVMASRD